MIWFNPDGSARVGFDVVNSSEERRRRIELPLADYLALTKCARTIEELRVLLFNYDSDNTKTLRAMRAVAGSEGGCSGSGCAEPPCSPWQRPAGEQIVQSKK